MNLPLRARLAAAVAGLVIMGASSDRAAAATPCSNLSAIVLPNIEILSADPIAAGPFAPGGVGGQGRGLTVPAFCRVVAVASPTADSHINIEVWLPPASNWNGKLLGTANGGFSGAIGYAAMARALGRGYATVGTDTGHIGDQMEFGRGHPEKIVDWAYRAVHVMTAFAKVIVRDALGKFPEHSYFDGCSTGGQQGLSEAQRYPEDYDGIVAGDPGNDRLHLIYGFLWSWLTTHTADGQPVLAPDDLALLAKGAMSACDAEDGVRDGIIGDPLRCRVNVAALMCKDGQTNGCLAPAKAAAAEKVYAGAKNPRTGEQIFPGWVPGSEQGWTVYITAPKEPVRIGLFTMFAFGDPDWNPRSFDWDRDVAYIDRTFPYLSAVSTDLRAFRSAGGKLIMYTGLADPVVPPANVIAYYDRVIKNMGGATATQTFFRFFPVPGMGHCGGGVGPSSFDALASLEQWVEHGRVPATILASHAVAGVVDRTRPLCPYPAAARYSGRGSIDDAANFSCGPAKAEETAAPAKRRAGH